MTTPTFTPAAVPVRKVTGRPKSPNPYLAVLSELVGLMVPDTDKNGEPTGNTVASEARSFRVDGIADRAKNETIRIAARRLDEAGRELGYTVRKEIAADGDGAIVTFYPVTKIERHKHEAGESASDTGVSAETAAALPVETAPEPATETAPAGKPKAAASSKKTSSVPKPAEDGYLTLA